MFFHVILMLLCYYNNVNTKYKLSQFAQLVDKSEMYIRQLASKGKIGRKDEDGRWSFNDTDAAYFSTKEKADKEPNEFDDLPNGRVSTMYIPYALIGTVSTYLSSLGIFFVPREYFTMHEAHAWQEGLQMLKRKGQTFDRLHTKWFSDIYNSNPRAWCENWYDFLEKKYGSNNPLQEGEANELGQ